MKVPEKIYIDHHPFRDEYEEYWYSAPAGYKSVEYIRTDAFIEKAINFIEMLGYGFTITDNITHTEYKHEQLVEDFQNFMKGE